MGSSSACLSCNDNTNTRHIMKLIIVSCLVAVALAAPQGFDQVQILRSNISPNEQGNFQHEFEADNGINVVGSGFAGSAGQSNMEGSYSYTSPEGTLVQVSYRCDENGCVYESPLIPQAPPHVAELLRIADEQRAQGITFN